MGNFLSSVSASVLNEIESKETENLKNPGTYEELHKACKEIYPVNFEGARMVVNKGLSQHFQISHTLNMSSVTPSGYKFGTTYIGSKQFSPNEAFPLLLGEIDPSGNLNAHIVHKFNERVMCKWVAQVQSSVYAGCQFSTDYRGDSFTGSVTLGNIDLKNNGGIIVGHFLKAVTPQISVGSEVVYQYGPQVPGGYIAAPSLAVRYRTEQMSAAASAGSSGVNLSYWRRCSDQVQVGCEFDTNLRMQESVGNIGYQVDLPAANLVFRGTLDSNLNIGAVLEKKLAPLPFTFALSGMASQMKNQFRFGMSLMIG